MTPLPPDCETFGPLAVAWGRRNLSSRGRPWEPFPWQQIALNHNLAHVNGRPLSKKRGVSVARQNGKSTGGAAPLIGWWLTERCRLFGEPQEASFTSNKLSTAGLFFSALADIFESRFGAHVVRTNGKERVDLPCGCRFHLIANTANAGHSLSLDLVVGDEIWQMKPEAWNDGLVPTTRARANSLVSWWSTAGDESSEVMLREREAGLRAIDTGDVRGVGLVEWSVPSDVDPMDERWWGWANPAMGKPGSGLVIDTLREEAKISTRAGFLRPALNMWVPAHDAWLDHGEWTACSASFDGWPAGGYVAVEQSFGEARFVGLRAVGVNGSALVGVEFDLPDEGAMWSHLVGLAAQDATVRFAVPGSLEVHIPPQLKGRVDTVGIGEIRQWTEPVRKMVRDRRVAHRGERLLSEHVARAVGYRHEGGFGLSSARSPGPIELARCLVWAVMLATRPGHQKVQIAMGGGR